MGLRMTQTDIVAAIKLPMTLSIKDAVLQLQIKFMILRLSVVAEIPPQASKSITLPLWGINRTLNYE